MWIDWVWFISTYVSISMAIRWKMFKFIGLRWLASSNASASALHRHSQTWIIEKRHETRINVKHFSRVFVTTFADTSASTYHTPYVWPFFVLITALMPNETRQSLPEIQKSYNQQFPHSNWSKTFHMAIATHVNAPDYEKLLIQIDKLFSLNSNTFRNFAENYCGKNFPADELLNYSITFVHCLLCGRWCDSRSSNNCNRFCMRSNLRLRRHEDEQLDECI